MASHTPGPWEHSDAHVFVLDDEHDEVICRLDGQSDWRVTPDADRAAANARLMASAPELLAALETLLAEHIGYAGDGSEDHECCVCKMARAAIRKARGV